MAIYVSSPASGGGGASDAENVAFTPAGSIAATDVQAAVEEVASEAVPADLSITPRKLSDLARSAGWLPAGAIDQTVPDRLSLSATLTITAGQLVLVGGCVIPGGRTVTSISFVSGNVAGASMTNQWFCLVDTSGNVLAKTTDDTSAAWGTGTTKTLNLSAPYTPGNAVEAYLGLVVAGTTPPNLRATATTSTVVTGIEPMLAATANSGLTNPASLGATIGAKSAIAMVPYGWIS